VTLGACHRTTGPSGHRGEHRTRARPSMKIVIIDGTGLIGSKLVSTLGERQLAVA
jgi:transposase